jgi:hypothetical protein
MRRIAITLTVTISAYAGPLPWSVNEGTFDDLALLTLDLSAHPELRYLSAQGNRLQGLDVSRNRQLDRLLFENRFGRRGIERLLSGLTAHGKRDGFLGLSGLRKQTLGLGGRVSLATFRSRNWLVPTPGSGGRFGVLARAFVWEPGALGQRETPPVWSYASSSSPANVPANLPLIGRDEGFFLDLVESRRLYFPPSNPSSQ